MDFKLGIISASLLLIIVQRSNSALSCTSLSDLAEPCGCPLTKESFDPICGSDGKSYLNTCFLECKQTVDDSNISVKHKGACSKDSPCTCIAIYSPVCGSNGVTYPNECVLKCNIRKKPSIRLKHRGQCDDSNERWRALRSLRSLCHCNPGSGTLCATNGVTYINFCVLQCKAKRDPSIKFDHMGPCEEHSDMSDLEPRLSMKEVPNKCICNPVKYARCGGVVEVTLNPCDLECESRDPKPLTPCEVKQLSAKDAGKNEDDSKTCFCAAVNRPVCASNRETYANICVLHCKAKKDSSIKFQDWGSCENIRLISRKTKQSDQDETLRNRNNRKKYRYTSMDTNLRAYYT